MALTASPGDGSYVEGALGATADQFLEPGASAATTARLERDPDRAGALPRLPLDRDTLSPGSDTAYSVTRNRGLGLRAEVEQPIGTLAGVQTRGFVAMRAGIGQHDYFLPQGLGPLSDPTAIDFVTGRLGVEVGLTQDRPLWRNPDLDLRLSLSAGHDLTQTHTTVQSALLDVSNTHVEGRSYLALGAGLLWQPAGRGPQVELHGEARLLDGGQPVLQTELRLTRH
ncbi:MAG: hypothetical protein WAT09_01535 [Paracoccaceae bacterium]